MKRHLELSWITRPRPCAAPRIRLLCAPYAGGGVSMFRTWPDHLPSDVELLAVQLPGRERRVADPPCTDLAEVVDNVLQDLLPYLDRPLALFGYSMGTRIAYELARTLREWAGIEPVHLFVGACTAPQLPESAPPRWRLPDASFKEALRRLGGTSSDVLENDELMELYLPMIRADFALKEGYVHRPCPPFACPVTAYCGTQDVEAPVATMQAWQPRTNGPFRLRVFQGGHFFLHSRLPDVLADIAQALSPRSQATPVSLPRPAQTIRI